MKSLRFSVHFLLILGLFSCQNQVKTTDQWNLLLNEEAIILERLINMEDSIRDQWDNLNSILKQQFPDNLSLSERKNMLGVRNANLIRMFSSFQSFDSTVVQSLNEVEANDNLMVKKIAVLRNRLSIIDSEKRQLYSLLPK